MNDVQQKWTHKFHIDDKTTEPAVFQWLSECYEKYLKRDDINDILNKEELEEYAIHKNKELNYELQKDKDKIEDLSNKVKALESKLSISLDARNTMKERQHADYESIHSQYDKVTNQLRQEYKEQIENLSNKNDQLHEKNDQLHEKMQSFSDNKKNKSSHAIGLEGEVELLSILEMDPSFEVKDTSKIDNSGDAEVIYKGKSLCIDSKKYNGCVKKTEVFKLERNIKRNDNYGGVIISWTSYVINPDTNKRSESKIDYMENNGKPILLLSIASEYRKEINSIIKLFFDRHEPLDESNTHMDIAYLQESQSQVLLTLKTELECIDRENKSIEGESKSFETYILRRKQELNRRKQACINMINILSCNNVNSDESITDIHHVSHPTNVTLHDIIKQHATKHTDKKGQRNSTHDIRQFFEHYCTKHNHTLNKVNRKQLNDILLSLGYQSEKKHGKNYQDKTRKKDSPTWPITLSPDLLN